MLRPAEYVSAALRGLSAGPLAGNAAALSHGGRTARAVRVGSVRPGEDPLSPDSPAEAVRVLASAADLPGIRRGDPATLGGSLRAVTSVRLDASGASVTVGLSDSFDEVRARYSRRGRAFPVSVLALEDAALPSAYADAAAPIEGRTWSVCIVAAEWPEADAPAAGDELRFSLVRRGRPEDVRLRVSSAEGAGGWWMLRARPRGSA